MWGNISSENGLVLPFSCLQDIHWKLILAVGIYEVLIFFNLWFNRIVNVWKRYIVIVTCRWWLAPVYWLYVFLVSSFPFHWTVKVKKFWIWHEVLWFQNNCEISYFSLYQQNIVYCWWIIMSAPNILKCGNVFCKIFSVKSRSLEENCKFAWLLTLARYEELRI